MLLILLLPCLLLLTHTQGDLCTQQVEELRLQIEEMKTQMEEKFISKDKIKEEVKKAEHDFNKEKLVQKEYKIHMKLEDLHNENLALRTRMEKHIAGMKKELTSIELSLSKAEP